MRAREALGRASQGVDAGVRGSATLRDGSFARRLAEEIAELDLRHEGLRRSLKGFSGAMDELVATRLQRDAVAYRMAETRQRLAHLHHQLEEARARLAEVCEGTFEQCVMKGELAGIASALVDEPRGAETARLARRIRALSRRSTLMLQALARAEVRLAELEERVASLEEQAAGFGLEVGGLCSVG